jgi:O-antigen/teichoic acid export membrane protein
MSSIKKLAIRGAVWTIASYGTSQILRFGSNLILTRLLIPDVFGLMALVYVFISGLHLFSDIGIGTSIIQNKRGDDPVFLNTAWTMQVIRGVGLWICSLLIAWPVAAFYAKPNQGPILLLLLPIVGLNTLISGFNSTALFKLNREIALGKLAIFELGGQISSLIVIIVWAWLSPTVWAIVAGSLVSAVVQLVWSHRLIPEQPNRFAWDKTAAKSIFSFGKWIFLSTVLTFLALQSDRLILGKLLSLKMLGVYGIAFTLADIPRSIISALSNKVIFPIVSKISDLPRETLRDKILKNRQPILIFLAVSLTFLIAFGDRLIFLLYKPDYHAAAWMLPIIALGIWHTTLFSTMSPALLALGKSHYGAQGYLLSFLTISIGLPLAFSQMGMVGAMFVIAFYDLPLYGVSMYGLWREGLSCLGQDLKATFLFLGLLGSVLLVRVTLGWGLPINQILNH